MKDFISVRCFKFLLLVLLSTSRGIALEEESSLSRNLRSEYEQDILPILSQHCLACHGPQEQNADLRFDQLSIDLVGNSATAESWQDALDVLNRGEMPPPERARLSGAEREVLVGWITQQIDLALASKRGTGSQTVLRRLNRIEYQNTMRDLLGLELDYASQLLPDEVSVDGFRNNGQALHMSSMQIEAYWQAARRGLSLALVDYPQPTVTEMTSHESVADKGQGNWTNRLGRSGVFVAKSLDFPDEGEFLIRVKARAEGPSNGPLPQLRVMLGYRADTQTPAAQVGLVDVTSSHAQTYEFRGRIEEFPRQSRTQSKYPGLLIWLSNAYSDGQPPPGPRVVVQTVEGGDRKKKKETRTLVWDEDPTFPTIVVESLEFRAPVFESWPPEHHTRIVPRLPTDREDELLVAEESLHKFMARAFRKPPTKAWDRAAVDTFRQIRPTADSFVAAMRETLTMILISPEFLYLTEPSTPAGPAGDSSESGASIPEEDRQLDNFQIASRLSYFLWSSMPDERLFQLARQGKLNDEEIRASEVERMLADKRSWSMVEQFSDQWLDLERVNRVAVNPEFYPAFDDTLKAEMRLETQHFFAEILSQNESALNFIDSPFLMLNERMAAHYDISGPRTSQYQRVALGADSPRGGLLTQASILLSGSNGEDSHPILRGVWVRDRLLGDPPAPPPPNVPSLASDQGSLANLPLKERLIAHRENEACANCHRGIDPWGIALEHFDAIGSYRNLVARRTSSSSVEATEPVDAQVELPNGQTLDGHSQLKQYLIDRDADRFARNLVERLLCYALGRSMELTDEPELQRLTDDFRLDGYRLKALVRALASSQAFITR